MRRSRDHFPLGALPSVESTFLADSTGCVMSIGVPSGQYRAAGQAEMLPDRMLLLLFVALNGHFHPAIRLE